MNLHRSLRFWATRWPDRLAVRCGDRDISWGELDRRSDELAAGLAAAGVRKGDRVGVLMRNRIEFIETLFGIFKCGGALTLLNIRFTPAELAYPVLDAGLKVVISQPDFLETLAESRARVPDLKVFMTEPAEACGALDDLRLAGAPAPEVEVGDDDVALVSYTSGTTGFPKGAMLTHANLREASVASCTPMGLTHEDRLVVSMPLAYTWGSCVYLQQAMLIGATAFVDTTFSADSLIDLFERERITAWSSVPVLFEKIAQSPRFDTADLSSLRNVSTGNASLHLLQAWQAKGVLITQTYGLTESTGNATMLFSEDAKRKIGTSGRPLASVDLKVVDEDGRALPAGQPGEVWLRGPTMMKGYLNKPEETARTLVDGWLRTGDVGVIDDEGFLTLIDRSKDMIRSGGLNVYPAELERVLAGVDGLEEFAVIGVADARWGEVAMVVAYGAKPLDVEGLKARAARELADYKRPHYAVCYDKPLPRTVSGKILKRELRLEFPDPPAHAIRLKG